MLAAIIGPTFICLMFFSLKLLGMLE